MSDNGPAGSWIGPGPSGAATHKPILGALTDAVTMSGRSLRMARRNVDALLTSLLLPVLIMLLFVYLFGGAIEIGTRYVTYVVPGVVLLSAGFGAATTAVGVTTDLTGGIIDRFRSLDVAGASILAGHVAASVVRKSPRPCWSSRCRSRSASGPAPGRWTGWPRSASWSCSSWPSPGLSAAFGLLARSPEAAGGFGFLVMFLPYPSSAFVPVETMPGWLHGIANNQPVTPVIETLRGLLLDTPVGASPWKALAWSLAILVAAVTASGVLFRRRAA